MRSLKRSIVLAAMMVGMASSANAEALCPAIQKVIASAAVDPSMAKLASGGAGNVQVDGFTCSVSKIGALASYDCKWQAARTPGLAQSFVDTLTRCLAVTPQKDDSQSWATLTVFQVRKSPDIRTTVADVSLSGVKVSVTAKP